jgi:hypothetical protein
MMKKNPMIKKLGIVALLALILIPAGVMATGFHGSGAGKHAASADSLQFQQQAENSFVFGKQYRPGSQERIEENEEKGEAQALGNRNCTMDCDQSEDQFRNQTRDHSCTTQFDQAGDLLQNMTRIHARLKDCSRGNCPDR